MKSSSLEAGLGLGRVRVRVRVRIRVRVRVRIRVRVRVRVRIRPPGRRTMGGMAATVAPIEKRKSCQRRMVLYEATQRVERAA